MEQDVRITLPDALIEALPMPIRARVTGEWAIRTWRSVRYHGERVK